MTSSLFGYRTPREGKVKTNWAKKAFKELKLAVLWSFNCLKFLEAAAEQLNQTVLNDIRKQEELM